MATAVLPDPALEQIWVDLGLVKAATADTARDWIVYVRASTPHTDMQNEIVMPEALQEGSQYFLANGKLTWEHVTHENRHDPSNYIGDPMEVRWDIGGETEVKGRLFPLVQKAQQVWAILQSGGKVKASIGGMVLKSQAGVIQKLLWSHLALTPWPVNDNTAVSLTPLPTFLKALGATTGTSAQPMVMEDLEGAMLGGTDDLAVKWQALAETLAQIDPDLEPDECKRLALAILLRRGETRPAYRSVPVSTGTTRATA